MQMRIDPAQLTSAKARLAVVVREGLKGHHVLFAAQDIAAASGADEVDGYTSRELATLGMALPRCATLDDARSLIAAATPDCRAAMARLYLRFLGRCAMARGQAS